MASSHKRQRVVQREQVVFREELSADYSLSGEREVEGLGTLRRTNPNCVRKYDIEEHRQFLKIIGDPQRCLKQCQLAFV